MTCNFYPVNMFYDALMRRLDRIDATLKSIQEVQPGSQVVKNPAVHPGTIADGTQAGRTGQDISQSQTDRCAGCFAPKDICLVLCDSCWSNPPSESAKKLKELEMTSRRPSSPASVQTVEQSAAAEQALYEYTAGGTTYEEEHFRQGFKAGAEWQAKQQSRPVEHIVDDLCPCSICEERISGRPSAATTPKESKDEA